MSVTVIPKLLEGTRIIQVKTLYPTIKDKDDFRYFQNPHTPLTI